MNKKHLISLIILGIFVFGFGLLFSPKTSHSQTEYQDLTYEEVTSRMDKVERLGDLIDQVISINKKAGNQKIVDKLTPLQGRLETTYENLWYRKMNILTQPETKSDTDEFFNVYEVEDKPADQFIFSVAEKPLTDHLLAVEAEEEEGDFIPHLVLEFEKTPNRLLYRNKGRSVMKYANFSVISEGKIRFQPASDSVEILPIAEQEATLKNAHRCQSFEFETDFDLLTNGKKIDFEGQVEFDGIFDGKCTMLYNLDYSEGGNVEFSEKYAKYFDDERICFMKMEDFDDFHSGLLKGEVSFESFGECARRSFAEESNFGDIAPNLNSEDYYGVGQFISDHDLLKESYTEEFLLHGSSLDEKYCFYQSKFSDLNFVDGVDSSDKELVKKNRYCKVNCSSLFEDISINSRTTLPMNHQIRDNPSGLNSNYVTTKADNKTCVHATDELIDADESVSGAKDIFQLLSDRELNIMSIEEVREKSE